MTEEQFKELKMAKKITETKTEESTEQTKQEVVSPVFTNKAFSVQYAGEKRYEIVCIEFNESGETSKSVVEGNLDIYEAQNAFRTHVINAGLFDRKDM